MFQKEKKGDQFHIYIVDIWTEKRAVIAMTTHTLRDTYPIRIVKANNPVEENFDKSLLYIDFFSLPICHLRSESFFFFL